MAVKESVTESAFSKTTDHYCKDIERINGGFCFELQFVTGLFLVKLQGYLHYKTATPQIVFSEARVNNSFVS